MIASAQFSTGHELSITTSPFSGNSVQEGTERMEGLEDRKECCGMLSSQHGMSFVLMKSEKL